MLDPELSLANPKDLAIPRCVATADEAVALLREHHAQWQQAAPRATSTEGDNV
jgi:hypothetical protein